MSAVHDAIAMAALSVQTNEIKNLFSKHLGEFKKSSWYPDYFADKSMTQKEKNKIDPQADRFIYPDPPKSSLQEKLVKISRQQIYTDAPPLLQFYLIKHYLVNAVKSLKHEDVKSAVKFCGVYSHVIADICEPIHALSPSIIDIVVPPADKDVGLELHANVEGLKAPVKIGNYKPKLLGSNLKQAEMGAGSALLKAHKFGAGQAVPIVQALYSGQVKKAVVLSGNAQSEAAKHFADFIYTVFNIASVKTRKLYFNLDLREYPPIDSRVDMLYRYKPLKDVSLIPYSKGKFCPLKMKNEHGKIQKFNGLGVVPFLGPPHTRSLPRECWIEYYLVPGAYKTFTARVGLNSQFKQSVSPVVFSVELDGKEAAITPPIKPSAPAYNLKVQLCNARWLKLCMRYHINPTRKQISEIKNLGWISHGIWGAPSLMS